MDENKLYKEIQSLKNQITSLEQKLNKSNSMFGRSYSQVGSSSSDFLIKTKGQVKIQWGNKFIDLIKDGKVNSDLKFIYEINSKEDIGKKNGIYVSTEGYVYLKTNNQIINISGDEDTTYVSFMQNQKTTSQQKLTALKNIGLIYDSIPNITDDIIENGIIYVTSEKKLYSIQNGIVSEFYINLPEIYKKQFIIEKNDDSQGSILIKGQGIDNSLAFDQLFIFTQGQSSYIKSYNEIIFSINNQDSVSFQQDITTFQTKVQSDQIQSINASSNSGFRLYVSDKGSTLEVDNLVVRNSKSDIQTVVIPEIWSYSNNIVVSQSEVEDNDAVYELKLKYENKYQIGDKLYIYGQVKLSNESYSLIRIPLEVVMIDTETNNSIFVQVIEGINPEINNLLEFPELQGQTIFLISTQDQITQIRYQDSNIDLLQYQDILEEQQINSIKSRLGNLSNLELQTYDNGTIQQVKDYGIFSDYAIFNQAGYSNKQDLSVQDNSLRFVTTQWIHKLLPKGSIIMFNGLSSEIPNGWAICDGNNGTPNLINKFVKASTVSGNTGGGDQITLTVDNLPINNYVVYHNPETIGTDLIQTDSTVSELNKVNSLDQLDIVSGKGLPINYQPAYYSLIYIMKII